MTSESRSCSPVGVPIFTIDRVSRTCIFSIDEGDDFSKIRARSRSITHVRGSGSLVRMGDGGGMQSEGLGECIQ